MYISLKWLNNYIDISEFSADEIADKLTTAGLEIDSITNQSDVFENFIVGFVSNREKHPDADKLSLCKVWDGEKEYDVVCGAANVDKGQKIILAKVGAIIPDGGFEIKKAKIRGAVSEGMICSEKELGISDNNDGILVLDENFVEGTPASEVFGHNDVVLEVAITPNRPDALSHFGIARDLAVMLNKQLKLPEFSLIENSEDINENISIEIKDYVKCPRYTGKLVKGITVKDSPKWMQNYLKAVGLRPINNIVDISNFVMYEIGQPLHTFDYDKINGKKIIIDSAGNQKEFFTLDSKKRELELDDLMIKDGSGSVAIAGVMGGENSEVTNETSNVFIESAYFNPSSVRKTAKRLGLSSDASYRFERGTNPDMTVWAAERAAYLIKEYAGGDIISGIVDCYPNKIENKIVELRFSRIKRILGYNIPESKVIEILNGLDIKVTEFNSDKLIAEVKPFRPDIEREIDLIEEVARIYGYDKIPDNNKITITLDNKIDETEKKNKVREILTSLGCNEILTNSLLSRELAEKYGNPIKMLNPQSTEMSHLRPSLLPGGLSVISGNLKVKEYSLALFEIGNVFEKKSEKIEDFDDFRENTELLIALTGFESENEWYSKNSFYDLFSLKGIINEFFRKISLANDIEYVYNFEEDNKYIYKIEIFFSGNKVGEIGELKEDVLQGFEIKQKVFVGIMDLDKIFETEEKEKRFNELLKFPKMIKDCAFVVDKNILSYEIENELFSSQSKLLKNIKLFDIFEDKSLGDDKKSIAFQLEYYSEEKTLKEEEVDKDFWKGIESVKRRFNAQLRG